MGLRGLHVQIDSWKHGQQRAITIFGNNLVLIFLGKFLKL